MRRIVKPRFVICTAKFLSIQAQDFIEEEDHMTTGQKGIPFLSIQAQDFIEECATPGSASWTWATFLSIQAQDFIEDGRWRKEDSYTYNIPEHSSSGLH